MILRDFFTEAVTSNAVTFFRGEPILSQERLNQLKSSIGKPYPIQRKEGSAANIGTYMSPDGNKATSFVQQALAGQGKGGAVTQIQVDPNSFSKGDGGIDEAVIITNIAGLVSDQTPNKNDPLRIQDRKQAMLKYLGPGVRKYLNDPLLSDPKMVQRWYNPEFAGKNWNTIKSGKQAVTKPGESEIQERMMSVLGPLAEKIRRDPEVISYFIAHNPGNWIEYNFRMNSDGSGTKVVDVKYYPPAKPGVAEAANPAQRAAIAIAMKKAHKKPKSMKEAVNRGDWVRHPDNQWQVGQIQSIDNGQALVTWKKTDKRRKALSSTHSVNDLQHARREFSQLSQPTHQKQNMTEGANPADTLYFFDVARGGRSFDHLDLKIMGLRQTKSGKWYYQPGRDSTDLLTNASLKHLEKTLNVPARAWKRPVEEQQLDELKCWSGYTRVPGVPAGAPGSCRKKTNEAEQCPECGGPMFSELMINEKQDACYYKVKSRYKVWPSAYSSGALVQCRKKGAANWGNKSQK